LSDVMRRGRTGDCKPWEAPHVGAREKRSAAPAAIAELRENARDEGYARGHAEGMEAARKTVSELASRLESILAALQQPLDAADDQVLEQVTSVAVAIARRLVRRELRTNPDEIIGVVREAMAVLPVGLNDIRLHLHPEDAKLVSEMLAPAKGEAAWQIIEDPVIGRGGCRISSPTSRVDSTVGYRLDCVINSMLGGERGKDNAHE